MRFPCLEPVDHWDFFQYLATYQFRPQLCCVVPVAQPSILPQAPGVELPTGGDGSAVRAAAGNVSDSLRLQGLDEARFVTVPKAREEGRWSV